jgi:hypothetical protein
MRLLTRPLYGLPADVAVDCIAGEEPPLGFARQLKEEAERRKKPRVTKPDVTHR